MTTAKKCETFAAENGLTFDHDHSWWDGWSYEVSVPEGMELLDDGRTGLTGSTDGPKSEMWAMMLADMKTCVETGWRPIEGGQ